MPSHTLVEFQSTPSSQRETIAAVKRFQADVDFNPLPPRRGRPPGIWIRQGKAQFQSTPSSQRETCEFAKQHAYSRISIHSLLAEGDEGARHRDRHPGHFNPLPPRRGRHRHCHAEYKRKEFQSTPSSQRETELTEFFDDGEGISIHSLLAEGDAVNSSQITW